MSSTEVEPGIGLFSISKLDTLPLDHQMQLNDFHTIYLIESGSFGAEIDEQLHAFESPSIFSIWSGHMHRFTTSQDLSGYAITFRHNFLPYLEAENLGYFLYSLYQHCEELNYLRLDRDSLSDMQLHFAQLLSNFRIEKNSFGYREMLQTGLLQIMIKMIRLGDNQVARTKTGTRTLSTYYSFLELLEYSFKKENEIGFYSAKLGLASRNLNEILRKNSAKTFKEIMLEKKCYEAKKLIALTNLSLKEIAYQLGFKSQSYFCYTFRKGSGITPRQYRTKTFARAVRK